jgi:chemotaxis signal transduction protein
LGFQLSTFGVRLFAYFCFQLLAFLRFFASASQRFSVSPLMLFLLFQLGRDRYAVEARRVVEVVPLLNLKTIPQAPKGVAGMIVYRGRAIPALDLCELTSGRPARAHLSTRILIINYKPDAPADADKPEKSAHGGPLPPSAARRADSRKSGEGGEPWKHETIAHGKTEIDFNLPGLPQNTAAAPAPGATTTAPGSGHWIALIAERATELLRREAQDFVEAGVPAGGAPYLGPVLVDEGGVIQLLHAEKLSVPRGDTGEEKWKVESRNQKSQQDKVEAEKLKWKAPQPET